MPPDGKKTEKKKKLQAGTAHISARVSSLSVAVLGSGDDGDMLPDAARVRIPTRRPALVS
jgi:hypothetical protein